MEITWFGHSNFRIRCQDQTLCIDPFFEGNPKALCSFQDIGAVQLVLVTHDHDDHVGQALELCTSQQAPLIAVFDTIQKFMNQGFPAQLGLGMNIGGTIKICDLEIHMVQAVHSSASGTAAGYILTFPNGFCIYHAGDTALFQSMALLPLFHKIDLALLPIGGRFTMDAAQAAQACALLQCHAVIPMHWGTFPALEQSTENFALELAKRSPHTKLKVLTPGTPTLLF